jgi:pimeloyl-ACP methyl ester carboxylesterase
MTFMRDIVGFPEREIEQVRQTPAWQARVAAAHTLPRELEADAKYRFVPERFRSMTVPTLLLTGEESPPMFREPVRLVDAALPNSRICILEGQQHLADVTAPELFVRTVLEFLRD